MGCDIKKTNGVAKKWTKHNGWSICIKKRINDNPTLLKMTYLDDFKHQLTSHSLVAPKSSCTGVLVCPIQTLDIAIVKINAYLSMIYNTSAELAMYDLS